jgi:hypothetical protein
MQLMGGIPVHLNGTTAVATVEAWTWQGGRSAYLWFENTGTGAIVISFTEADATAGNGITVAAGEKINFPVQAVGFWTQSAAAESWQALALIHRG